MSELPSRPLHRAPSSLIPRGAAAAGDPTDQALFTSVISLHRCVRQGLEAADVLSLDGDFQRQRPLI